MTSNNQIINKLNEIRSSEQRMSLVYHQCAAQVTGPYRIAMSEEFASHAEDETEHAHLAMTHLIAMGGDLDQDIKTIPPYHNLNEMLAGLDDLEEKGVRLWQELMDMLPRNDAFRHTIEGVLSKEQEHWDDVRRWRREDYAEKAMSLPGDIGSLVPLNLHLRRSVMPSPVQKSESHEARIANASRAGTPPTRWGMYHGTMPSTTPGTPDALNPRLYIGKAVIDPAQAGTGSGDSAQRKRDPSTGKFAQAQSTGQQSTAEEDLAAQQRAARLSQQRYQKALQNAGMGQEQPAQQQPMKPQNQGGAAGGGMPQLARPKPANPMQQAGVPASPPGQGMAGINNAMGDDQMQGGDQAIGQTQEGMPIYDDPYHPEHSNFTPDQHQAAADLHNQQAEMHTSSGRIPTALDHQLKARIHTDLAQDGSSPMQRMLSRQGMPGQAQGQGNQMPGAVPPGGAPVENPMDDFLTQMSDKKPGNKNAIEDQNKPNFGQPQDNQGPLPRMTNTNTNSPVGPQSQSASHAGTVEQPQMIPPGPPPGNGSMPEISGPKPMPTQKDPLQWDPKDFEIEDEGGGGHQGMGAAAAPPTHGGAATQVGPDEGVKPTPGSTESEPSTQNAGPSTSDTPASVNAGPDAIPPFGGNETDEKAKKESNPFANKSFANWFASI